MKKLFSIAMVLFIVGTFAVTSIFAQDDDMMETVDFVHGFIFTIDDTEYYMDGSPDGPNGEIDVPGHDWIQVSETEYVALHYNTGPNGAESWWSSDADDGELLYVANVVIDTWSEEKAAEYIARGYVHYHEFVSVEDGSVHPEKVAWFQHIALTSFNLDGGPLPDMGHEVTPGLDFEFMPNAMKPYTGESDD